MQQALYWLTLRLELENGTVSDTAATRFGVREVHSEVDPVLQGHVFYVNGQRVGYPAVLSQYRGCCGCSIIQVCACLQFDGTLADQMATCRPSKDVEHDGPSDVVHAALLCPGLA